MSQGQRRRPDEWKAMLRSAGVGLPTADGWVVFLPHQCESWDIAGENARDGVPHAEAVAALEAFLAEGQAALEALRQEREIK